MVGLAQAVLTSPDATEPSLRRAIETRAAVLAGTAWTPPTDVPGPIIAYVENVALHAYKIVDDDVAALKIAGYSQDAIFEITLCAALGAGRARLERGFAALRGEARCACNEWRPVSLSGPGSCSPFSVE